MSGTAIQVRPQRSLAGKTPPVRFVERAKSRELATALYHWAACLFIVSLVCSQLLSALWDSRTTTEHLLYGRSPLLGPFQIVGTNDVPFPDRVIACVSNGRFYQPRLVSSLLAAPGVSAILEDATGTAMHGYRLKQRRAGQVTDSLDSSAQAVYETQCSLIASTIDNILAACSAVGYSNLTRENLYVVDDWDSKRLFQLPHTLPVLIMPFWDNSLYARHVVPTWGGDACIFRLEDAYTSTGDSSAMASFRAVNRSVRYERTLQWLQRPGGYWKNGWYEDPGGMRWYSDIASSTRGPPYDMMHRVFDMKAGRELACLNVVDCEGLMHIEQWGNKFSSGSRAQRFNSVFIANATEFGLGLYESYELRIVRSVFDWETLVSNLSVALVLIRWVFALASLHLGAWRRKSLWFGGGIGCVSGARSFAILPLVSLPRMTMTLTAFWTVGCKFEGQQNALAEAWFFIYPAIIHFVLVLYSLLNLVAKVLRRRVSDVLFAPTVLSLCLLHYFRLSLAESGWMEGVDGRVPTVIFSDEVKNLQLADYFTTDAAWRMNGRVKFLVVAKLLIVGLNLLPLVLARPFPSSRKRSERELHGVEKALALRARHVGGLGCSLTYMVAVIDRKQRRMSSASFVSVLAAPVSSGGKDVETSTSICDEYATPITVYDPEAPDSLQPSSNRTQPDLQKRLPREIALVNSYELIRLGYLVFGDKYLITFDEWDVVSSMAPFRAFCRFWNHRVLVWTLRPVAVDGDAEIAGGRALEWLEPQLWRLDDQRLQSVRWWQVSACSIQC
jgi:hypothetical protein